MKKEVKLEKLQPDADAGISRFLAIFASVGLARAVKLSSIVSAHQAKAPVVFNGRTGKIVIDALPLCRQLEVVKDSEVEMALRPLFGAALTTGYEALKEKAGLSVNDERPVVQFLRHVRNGISHNNIFDIRGDEPRKPAN